MKKSRRYPSGNADPGDDVIPITASTTNDIWGVAYDVDKSVPCVGLMVGTGGTATVRTAAGNIRTDVPLQTGWNPLGIVQLRSLGTALNVWAVMN